MNDKEETAVEKTADAKLQARSTAPTPSAEERKARSKARREKVPSEAPYSSPAGGRWPERTRARATPP